jgi:hypothetical protein
VTDNFWGEFAEEPDETTYAAGRMPDYTYTSRSFEIKSARLAGPRSTGAVLRARRRTLPLEASLGLRNKGRSRAQ